MKAISSRSIVLLLLGFIFTSQIYGQTWTDEQKEVWSGIEEYWKVSAAGNAEEFLKYFDESYAGWSYNTKVPMSKANTGAWIRNDMKNNSTVLYTLTPVTIWVNGDFAFANYFYSQIEKDKDGKETPQSGHWTDILMKKNGKWLLVGDRGGRTSGSNN
jgi:ketosteroid isomerase-like protein